ncbi:MAG TPA: hypothetical protein VLA49_01775 [Anaerolineales bacterium]|nr:hypothetical protein [Anaerolineales bacterium]
MTLNDATEIRINQYLEAVRSQLSGVSREEADTIIADLREHIDTNLQTHGNRPSLKAVEAVLADMDPPESFSPEINGGTEVVPRVSRLAVAGAVLLPFGIFMIILLLVPVSSITISSVDGVASPGGPQVAWWQWLLRFTVLPLGFISPFASTGLGLAAISQIRASKGKLVGKPLALIVALFYPLLVLDAILIGLFFLAFSLIPDGYLALKEILSLMSIALVAIIDLLILWLAWSKIR